MRLCATITWDEIYILPALGVLLAPCEDLSCRRTHVRIVFQFLIFAVWLEL